MEEVIKYLLMVEWNMISKENSTHELENNNAVKSKF